MESMMGALMNSLSGDNVSMIGKLIGVDSHGTKSLLGTAAPLLMGALAKTATKPGATDTLMNMIGQRNLTGVADDVGGYLRNPDIAGGASIVGNLLGSQQDAITKMIAQKTGASTDASGRILAIIAPIVLGFIGKMMGQQKMNASTLTSFLGEQSKMALKGAPDAVGILNAVLGVPAAGSGLLGRLKRLFGG